MCIALLTTAHPGYPLILLDNRDEFVLRPTSRPHWWQSSGSSQSILSSRDLQRSEQGTWMGVTKSGNLAVLTNYKEEDTFDQPLQGQRSRGAMVTAWLTAPEDESISDFVKRLMAGEGVKGVGGFSLLCGKLRKIVDKDGNESLEPFAIISNRAGSVDEVPWIGGQKDDLHALSNTFFDDPVEWPKVTMGKDLLDQTIKQALAENWSQDELVDGLFTLLNKDTMPPSREGESFEEYTYQLRKSIFIPPIGTEDAVVPKAEDIAAAASIVHNDSDKVSKSKVSNVQEKAPGRMTGVYGTQRQTIILVDSSGKVTFRERALWDDKGNLLPIGKGDVEIEFHVDTWTGTPEPHTSRL